MLEREEVEGGSTTRFEKDILPRNLFHPRHLYYSRAKFVEKSDSQDPGLFNRAWGGGSPQVSFVKKSVRTRTEIGSGKIKSPCCCVADVEGVGEQLRGTGFGPPPQPPPGHGRERP